MGQLINETLLVLLENQRSRTEAALEGLEQSSFIAKRKGECNSIRDIGRHMLKIRAFQLSILDESPDDIDTTAACETPEALRAALDASADVLSKAIRTHEPEDWMRVPRTPREGNWGDEPTLFRLVRPLNDVTNHLGAIRALRRIDGNPATRTQ